MTVRAAAAAITAAIAGDVGSGLMHRGPLTTSKGRTQRIDTVLGFHFSFEIGEFDEYGIDQRNSLTGLSNAVHHD